MTVKIKLSHDKQCPCGGKNYTSCCMPYHQGDAYPETPEKLMRSRYSAYALNLTHYLEKTWHESTRPNDLSTMTPTKWIELIIQNCGYSADGSEGFIEFTAKYRNSQGKAEKMHEKSRFVKNSDDHWVYIDGEVS